MTIRLDRLALCLALVTGPVLAAGASDTPLFIEEAAQLAREREPGEMALRHRSQALGEDAVAAGQLPDPTLRAGILNLPSETLDFDREPMTQLQVGVQQAFPPSGARRASTGMLEAQAAATIARANDRARRVALDARTAWLELYYRLHARDTIQASRRLFAELVEITQSLYAVGQRDQHDVIRAQLELHRLDDRLLDMDESVALARADLARWIGAAAERPLGDELPDWTRPPGPLTAARLGEHPVLLAAGADIRRAEQDVAHAQARYRPTWSLDFAWGIREGEDTRMQPREDFVSFMVRTELPFFTGRRQDRRLSAAHERHAASVEQREEQRRRLQNELDRQLARWQQLGKRLDIFAERIVPESEMRSRAALLSYQSDTGDFTDVMRAYIEELDARLERLRLQVDRLAAHAHLAYLLGESS